MMQGMMLTNENGRRHIRVLSLIVVVVVVLLAVVAHGDDTGGREFKVPSGMPDPFVQAAPLVVAMACRDGVAIVAAHSSPDNEPLLFYDEQVEASRDENDTQSSPSFLDLPSSYAGPYRIHPVGAGATALMACGWRADGSGLLWDEAREIAAREMEYFGQDIDSFVLASQLSVFLADYAVRGSRALSCAALVASIRRVRPQDDSSKDSFDAGCLWLVDATGAYPVLAHCLGGGWTKVNTNSGSEKEIHSVSDVVNSRLRRMLTNQEKLGQWRRPYVDVSASKGLDMLLSLFSHSEEQEQLNSENESGVSHEGSVLLPPDTTRLELAIVYAARGKIIRQRLLDKVRNQISK